MILAAIRLDYFSKLTSPQYNMLKIVRQYRDIVFDGNDISCLISNELRPDDAAEPQTAPNSKFLGGNCISGTTRGFDSLQ